MNGRDCVRAALGHTEPERVPVDLGGRHATMHVLAHRALKAHLGILGGDERFRQFWLQTVDVDPRLTAQLGGDVLSFCTAPPDSWTMTLDEATRTFTDEWGAQYRMPPGGMYYDYHAHPLANAKSLEDVARYAWPDPADPGRYRGLRESVRAAYDGGEKAIMMTVAPAGSWEHTWTLRGPEQALIDLVSNRLLYEEILERTVTFQLALWERALESVGEYIDVAALSDDLGTQEGPMISPRTYREIFKPRLRRLTDLIHSRSRAKVYLHTDGSVYAFLPDLIDAGVEVINPVQTECRDMEPARLKREFGHDLAFWGAGCNTRTLELGSPEEVRQQARRALSALGPGGGYVFAAIHNIQPNVPPENVVALFAAARDSGRYPIRLPE